jgi:hypothetical protein
VPYEEDGHKLETDDDVADDVDVRRELHAVEQHRLERQHQPAHQASKSMPLIHITNVNLMVNLAHKKRAQAEVTLRVDLSLRLRSS